MKWNENIAVQSTPNIASEEGENNVINDSSKIENKIENKKDDKKDSSNKPTIGDAWNVIKSDKKILLLGAVQSLFEGTLRCITGYLFHLSAIKFLF